VSEWTVATHAESGTCEQAAVGVPQVRGDRESYAPFEVMRFHLVRFMDEMVDMFEAEPDLLVFMQGGQAVIVEDWSGGLRVDVRRGEAEHPSGRRAPRPRLLATMRFYTGSAPVEDPRGLEWAAWDGWEMGPRQVSYSPSPTD
jgi:hypothetical protein